MTTKSQAIEQLAAIKSERDRLNTDAQAINGKADALRQQLAELEAAQAGDAEAVAGATTALAAALEAGDLEAIESARNRAAAASKAEAKASARKTEMEALKAAIEALHEKARPIGSRMIELHQKEQALGGQRLQEVAAEVGDRYKAVMHDLADVVAEAQALGILAIKLDINASYAPPPFALPSVIGENMGASGRIVVDLAPLRQRAAAALVDRMHAEGFTGA